MFENSYKKKKNNKRKAKRKKNNKIFDEYSLVSVWFPTNVRLVCVVSHNGFGG